MSGPWLKYKPPAAPPACGWPELPPVPDDDERARWLRGEIDWTTREDVRLVVEDLADQGMKAGRISRLLGLTRAEIITILRRAGSSARSSMKSSV